MAPNKGSLAGYSSDDEDSSPNGQSGLAASTLYKSWMTGFSYEACRNLYLPDGVPPSNTDDQVRGYRDKILPWLSTYLNLVSELCAVGMDDVTDDLERMLKKVRGMTDPLSSVSDSRQVASSSEKEREGASADDKFDSDFDLVLGAIRAREPYGCYAALSGEFSSRLTHPRQGDTQAKLAALLRDNLGEMKNVLPDGAYEVIDSDLGRLQAARQGDIVAELENQVEAASGKRALNEEIATWTDLMFGVATPDGILSAQGRGLAYTLVVVVGLGLILGIGLVIFLVLKVVANIPGMDVPSLSLVSGNNFISTVETVSTTLTTVGLSFGLLVTKAWASLQAFERAALLFFAKMPRFRRHVEPVYGR
ncbi:MAG TPA: hypothetical protein VGS04_05845 [Nitrososphaerales archaeon]|nr:hypothetical protein [Nitrososphaerales archaeon]